MGLHYQAECSLSSPGSTLQLAFSNDGQFLAGGTGRRVTLWDAKTGREMHRIDTRASALCLSWGDLHQLHCGFADGYLLTLILDDTSKVRR
jgi:WD40 repeat protein